MKKGFLVINHFLSTKKFTEHYEWLSRAAEKNGIALNLKTGAELLHVMGESLSAEQERPDFMLFWDKDVRLALALENMGFRLFNSARSIALCDDKSLTHLALSGKVPMPKTICAPMTYLGVGYSDLSFVKKTGEALGYPMIVKECFGSFGSQVYLVKNLEEAEALTQKLAGTPFVFQRCITSSLGRDVRIQVVGDQVIAAMLRYNETGDFRANISGGGSMKPYSPSQELQALAVEVCKILGLDFAGVDFLFGSQGEPILCEVNSNAHFKNLYDCTGVNAADAIMAHIAKTIG